VTRVLRPPKRIDVTLDSAGRPRIVRLDRNFDHVSVVEEWRVSERWLSTPMDRAYVKVVGPTWLVLIFQDLFTGDWFLERIFD
jgi:hypothetical protein